MKIGALALLFILIMASVIPSMPVDAEIVVEDGIGNTFSFDGPVDHVIAVGVGVTATVIGVGALDKLCVCDSYSRTNADPIFDGLRAYADEGKVAAGGNIYSSGKEQLKVDIIDAADPLTGSFDKEHDVVFAVVSPSYRANLDFLQENGFKNVMYWDAVYSYEEIIGFVETISLVCNGKVEQSAATMRAVSDTISITLEQHSVLERCESFYVTYSSGSFKVGNTGSVTTAMIEAAGGVVITKDPERKVTTYETSLTMLVQEHPDAVIFIDNTVATSSEYLGALKTQVGDDVRMVPLEQIWNNYSIKSSEGVWTMACAMYPDLFTGDVPTPSATEEDVLLYLAASVAISILIIAGSLVYMRR